MPDCSFGWHASAYITKLAANYLPNQLPFLKCSVFIIQYTVEHVADIVVYSYDTVGKETV